MLNGQTLQDKYLDGLQESAMPVAIYLVNGIKLQGEVEYFDETVILLKSTINQIVYKHAISTVVPARSTPPLTFSD